jgi:CheY-like chemotaxis protein
MSESTLLVADDHPLFRAAVIHVLRESLPQFAVLEAASAATLGTALQQHPEIELVLLDLAMPGARGFSALLHVRGEYPDIPVVVISSNDHPRVIRRAQQFGAAGFIPKSAPAEAIAAAIIDISSAPNSVSPSRPTRRASNTVVMPEVAIWPSCACKAASMFQRTRGRGWRWVSRWSVCSSTQPGISVSPPKSSPPRVVPGEMSAMRPSRTTSVPSTSSSASTMRALV